MASVKNRTLKILDYIVCNKKGVTYEDISAHFGFSMKTARRCVGILVAIKFKWIEVFVEYHSSGGIETRKICAELTLKNKQ